MLYNTARIAKNTLMLYFRQIVIMLVSLYTVRVVLETLGAEDYGIYNVVGGVVVLFTFLNVAMTGATQRFLNFALGQNDVEQARNVYSTSIIIHILIAVLVVILAQTVGLWLFHTWLNIPPERQGAAFIVYQISVVKIAIGILQVPYRAIIIAHEKMSFFTVLSIVEAISRLGIAFLLPVILFDKLVAYAFLVCIALIIIFFVTKVYCNRAFEIAHFRYCRDKELFRKIISFSGWTILGGVANVGRGQGTNILVNIFHGVTINASMGIAEKVNAAIYRFLGSFQTAFSPQIIKSYSAKEYDYFMQLVFRTSKASFCLLFFLVLPLYVNACFVLQIWLVNVPEYVVVFTRLSLLLSLIHAISAPLWVSIQATGEIKFFQIIASCFRFSNLPLSLLFLWMGFSPVWVFIIRIGVEIVMVIWGVFFLGGKIKLPVLTFFCGVIVPAFVIAGVSATLTFLVHSILTADWGKLITSTVISTVSIGALMYLIGLNKQERFLLQGWLKEKIRGN